MAAPKEEDSLIANLNEGSHDSSSDVSSSPKKPEELLLKAQQPIRPLYKGLAVLYFTGASLMVQISTKTLLTVYGFNFPVTLCLGQMAFSAAACFAASGTPFSRSTCIALIPLAIVHCCNTVAGLVGTGGLSVPMFTELRRFTMVLTIVLEYFVFSKSHHWQVLASVAVMMGGAVLAIANDLAFSWKGYLAVLFNDLFSAAYLVMLKHYAPAKEIDSTSLLGYSSLLSIAPLLVASWSLGEMQGILDFPVTGGCPFAITVGAALTLGLTINHSTYVCTRMNKPLTTQVAGATKNIAMTVIGMVAFGDYIFQAINFAGIAIGMLGAIWYSLHTAFSVEE